MKLNTISSLKPFFIFLFPSPEPAEFNNELSAVQPHSENITDTKDFTNFQFYIIKSRILILQEVILNISVKPMVFGNGTVKLAIEKYTRF